MVRCVAHEERTTPREASLNKDAIMFSMELVVGNEEKAPTELGEDA